jgi:hypothetical protein
MPRSEDLAACVLLGDTSEAQKDSVHMVVAFIGPL